VLTGANRDGACGLAAIKSQGGIALVEDPALAACPEMPKAAIANTEVDRVLSLVELGPLLGDLCYSVTPQQPDTSPTKESYAGNSSNSSPGWVHHES
jgi:chemotaxis response regulator CheB